MSLIKQVEDLKSAGRSDSQIVSDLRNQGFMPREIEDALSQFQVKNAVSQEYGSQNNSSSDSNMQQSIMTSQVPQPPAPNNFSPPPVPSPNSQQGQQSDYQQQSQPSEQSYYEGYSSQPQSNDNYPQYSYSQPSGSEAFSEIAEQVFDQKIVKIKSELSKLDDFKSDTDSKVSLLKERIKRIESIIDSLQDSIIRKIGEYGQNIQDLGSDLQATQNSFSKMVEPLSRRVNYSRVSKPIARKRRAKKKVVK